MKLVRALLALAVLAVAVSVVHAQVPPETAAVVIPIVSSYDYDSSTATYCVLGPQVQGLGTVSTSGSSATLEASRTTSFTSTITQFAELSMRAPSSTVATVRIVDSVTDGDTLVMRDVATIAAGTEWSFRNITCGTAATSGWFPVGAVTPSRNWNITVKQISLASGSMAVTIWCRGPSVWTDPVKVYPAVGASGSECATGLFTTTTALTGCEIVDNDIRFRDCRIGVTLTDDAGDLTTNREQVTFTVTGSQQ